MTDRAQDTTTASTLDAAQALDPRALVALRDNQRQLDQDGVEVGVSRQALYETLAHLAALQQQLDEARAANERDRTEVIDAVNSLKAEFVGRNWLIGESRGSYEWDDDRFRQEFRDAMAAFAPHVERLRKIGADHSNCPTSHDAIKAARAELALSEARATLSLIANDLRVAQWVRSMAANGAHDVSARDAPQAQPVVKALPWYKPMGSLTLSRADTDLGIYRAWSHHEADGKWFWSLDGYEKLHGDPVEDEEAAKAAAQADFERRILSALTRPSPPTEAKPVAALVETSIDTMREAANDELRRNGWHKQPNARLALHQVKELMAAFGMHVYRGEVGCNWPNCGCCADAACADALPAIARPSPPTEAKPDALVEDKS